MVWMLVWLVKAGFLTVESGIDITSPMSQVENHIDLLMALLKEPSVKHTEGAPEPGETVLVILQASLFLILIPILPIHQVVVQLVEADLAVLALAPDHPTLHTLGIYMYIFTVCEFSVCLD